MYANNNVQNLAKITTITFKVKYTTICARRHGLAHSRFGNIMI